MRSLTTPFFATANDILSFLLPIESGLSMRYVRTGTCDSEAVTFFDTVADIPSLGVAEKGDQVLEPSFLVVSAATGVVVRRLALRDGSTRLTIDQLENPSSVVLSPGGVFRGEDLIAGSLGTGSFTDESRALYKEIVAHLRKRFAKVRSFYVGPEASQALKNGRRLTTCVRAPLELDLVPPDRAI